MINRLKNKLLLEMKDFSPSHESMKIVGVFNPGVCQYKDEIILLVRVAETSTEERPTDICSPRRKMVNGEIETVFDYINRLDLEQRKVPTRLAFISHLEIVRLDKHGYEVKSIEKHPDLFGLNELEEFGIEDSRITQIGDTYYITYVAVSESANITTCLMTTKDFKTFDRKGIIFPCENKDVVIHPEKFNGLYYCYHRPVPSLAFSGAGMMVANSPDLLHWGEHKTFLPPGSDPFDKWRNGAGTTALKTKKGWLQMYHGVSGDGGRVKKMYTGGCILTSLDDPTKIIAKSKEPLLSPTEEFELSGYVPRVVFPTGWIVDPEDSNKVILYYGCADTSIAVVTLDIDEMLDSMTYL